MLEKEKKKVSLVLRREGHFWHSGKGFPLSIEKRIVVNEGAAELTADYTVTGEVDVVVRAR